VNSQKHQIQTLIAEIDALLQSTGPRLPWFAAKSTTQPWEQQRQTLKRLRQYLVQHQQELTLAGRSQSRQSAADRPATHDTPAITPTTEAQHMLQVLTQEIRSLRTSVLQPLRAEVVTLMQQRDALEREVQQLKAQSSSALETIAPVQLNQSVINEFLQVLMTRLQENLAQQVVQVLENHGTLAPLAPAPVGMVMPETWDAPLQHSTQQLEQIQQLHDRTDQVLGNLDSTLSVVFESLHRNIQTYQDSLAQGVDKMHDLGQQGEAMISTLVAQLTQQLQQAALVASPAHPAPVAEVQRPPASAAMAAPLIDHAEPAAPVALVSPDNPKLTVSGLPPKRPPIALPYPGTELRSPTLPLSETGLASLLVNPPPLMTSHASVSPNTPLTNQDEINSLTDLLQQLTNPAEAAPVVVPIGPPDAPPNPLPPLDTAVAAPGLTNSFAASMTTASPVPAPDAAEIYSIFSLEGMDDLFLDPPDRPPGAGQSPIRDRPRPDLDQH
jgi:hypothetical protein